MEKITYTCPWCGKKGVFGEHFCKNSPAEGASKGEIKLTGRVRYWNPWVAGALALVFSVAFLWQSVGIFSLGLLGLIPLIYLARWVKEKLASGQTPGYQELLLMTGQDKELVKRLIKMEQNKNPALNTKEAVASALAQLKYERSR